MRLLVAGDWHSDIHEQAISDALMCLGHSVEKFPWIGYFRGQGRFRSLSGRVQNKLVAGPRVLQLNRDLLHAVEHAKPDAVFIYRGTHVLPETIRKIRRVSPGSVIVGYNNDDPFSPASSHVMWRHFLRAVPEYDLMLAYRPLNVEDFRKAGARRVELLRSWFVEEKHKPLVLQRADADRYACDVVFAGHFEPDGRAQMLESIVREGYHLRLFGPEGEWDDAIRRSEYLSRIGPVKPVWGESYGKALTGAKVALCFLSKLNRDTYTRRVFEITAFGRFLLSEYSEDLALMFREGEEAAYFRSEEEMLRNLRLYLANDDERRRVAQGGLYRVHKDGHSVRSRAGQIVKWIDQVRSQSHRNWPAEQ